MWLTASAWLPAGLLDAVAEPAPAEGNPALEAAFGQGGPLDAKPPGPVLTAFLTEASAPAGAGQSAGDPEPLGDPEPAGEPGPAGAPEAVGPDSLAARIASGVGLAQRGDDALLGLIRGWRKIASLAAAAELAAVSEFTSRRHEQAKADGAWDSTALDAADVEIAAALTLTTRGTQLLMDRADMLHELPATATALAAGLIDWPKALVLINGLNGQDPSLGRRIEAQLIGRAPQQTTGQLRTALNRALLAADPQAAELRRQAEEQHARIERGPEPGGVTALLAGRCLPVTETVTAWNRITAIARQLRAAGADGSLDELRVHVYLALLNGQAVTAPSADSVLPGDHEDDPAPEDEEGRPSPGSDHRVAPGADARPARPRQKSAEIQGGDLRRWMNITVPLSTVLGFGDGPGELGGFGPITGYTARQLVGSAVGQPGVRLCVTVTDDQGQAIGHGCARAGAAPSGPGWLFTMKLAALAGPECAHERESAHYRPPPSLSHLVQTRNVCCTAPGCRIAASVCDDDHTVPFDQGGRTCECNLGPLCRRHHRVKQARGWRLEQPEPGVFAWITPSGRSYTTGPTEHVA
jgi:hypothetical protein